MIDKRGLQRFTKAVNYLADDNKEYRRVIGGALADAGRNVADDEFQKYHFENGQKVWDTPYAKDFTIIVGSHEIYTGRNEITATGKGVYYAEFGTGILGELGDYKGKLPTENRTFISHGQILSTDGWVYNYYQKLYDKEAEPWNGFAPIAGLYKAGDYLRKNCVKIAKDALRGVGKRRFMR